MGSFGAGIRLGGSRGRSSRGVVDNPLDMLSSVIDIQTNINMEKSKLNAVVTKELLKRQWAMEDYKQKDLMTRQRQQDATDYRIQANTQKDAWKDPALMSGEMVNTYVGDTGEPRRNSYGDMVSPGNTSPYATPAGADYKKFRLGILQRADRMAQSGERPPLTETQTHEMLRLRDDISGAAVKPSSSEKWISQDGKTERAYIWNPRVSRFEPSNLPPRPVKSSNRSSSDEDDPFPAPKQ